MPQETFPKPRKEINDPKEAELAALRERNEQLETEKAGMAELLGKVGEKADRTHIEGEKFKHEATHDKLTGLLRRSDDKELEKLLSETGLEKKDRREAHEIFTVVMLDIDHFKEINDTYGHKAGDQVLKAFADYLLSVTRKDDRVERRGGEEFLLVLAGGEQEGVIKKLAGKKLPVEITAKDGAEQVVEITFSGGVTSFTPGAKSLEEGIMAADKALYIAKEEGRNQILIAEEK